MPCQYNSIWLGFMHNISDMSKDDWKQFWDWVEIFQRMGHRTGQAYMNALHKVDEDMYMAITTRETDMDCFYDDSKADAFLKHIGW